MPRLFASIDRSRLPSRGRTQRLRLPSILATLLCACAAPAISGQTTISVPGTVGTIQGAIDLALSGDVIEVGPGTYFETIGFLGKEITVRSTFGPTLTTIDANSSGTVVTMASGEGPGAILEGFTIRGGLNDSLDFEAGGGGIFILGGAPTIRGNLILGNVAAWRGAGLYASASDATVIQNTFLMNSFSPVILDTTTGVGGGLSAAGGTITVVGNRFLENSGPLGGGAIHLVDVTDALLLDNECNLNTAGEGGAIFIGEGASVTVSNLLAVQNSAIGTFFFGVGGATSGLGGAIAVFGGSSVTIESATIVANVTVDPFETVSVSSGGGIYVESTAPSTVQVLNSIVRDNFAMVDPQLTPVVNADFSNIEGGFPGGLGIIDADPLFVSGPTGSFSLSQIAAGQGLNSPCVDAGFPASPLLDGTTRTDGGLDTGIIDLGWHSPIGDVSFVRGDCNADGALNLTDGISLLSYLFLPAVGSSPPTCESACDATDNGSLDLADAIAILLHLFGTTNPPLPSPAATCGPDPTPETGTCDSFGPC